MTPTSTSASRVAVVTGANKGIGYYIALQLGLSGLFNHVLLGCRDATRAQAALDSIQQQLPSTVKVSTYPFQLGDHTSHVNFAKHVESEFGGKVDCLVNNAAMAYKGADPTPFEKQCQPTLDVNFRGTVDFTELMLPLLGKGDDPRLVNVASMAGRLGQVSPALQAKFSSDTLTMDELQTLVDQFQHDVLDGTHQQKGWGSSNYGFSKLAVIAATKVWARQYPTIAVNCCCPGYCKTDMTSQKGMRPPDEGAKNAVIPATIPNPPTGQYYSNFAVAEW